MEPTPPDHPPTGAPIRPLWRRILSPWNVITLVILIWAAPRLLPHVGALVGIESGGSLVPTYSVVTLEGEPLSGESLRGDVVLVNVWATWCAPCRVEMPLLQAMHERHASRGFTLLGLSVDRTGPEGVRTFLEERGITYPVAIVGSEVERAFGGVQGYPTSFLLDRQGVIRHAVMGPLGPATLELAVRRLLDEPLP